MTQGPAAGNSGAVRGGRPDQAPGRPPRGMGGPDRHRGIEVRDSAGGPGSVLGSVQRVPRPVLPETRGLGRPTSEGTASPSPSQCPPAEAAALGPKVSAWLHRRQSLWSWLLPRGCQPSTSPDAHPATGAAPDDSPSRNLTRDFPLLSAPASARLPSFSHEH